MCKSKYSCYTAISLFFVGSFVLSACGREPLFEPINTPTAFLLAPTKTAVPTVQEIHLPEIDLVIDLEKAHQSTIKVQEGDVFQIKRPSLADEWQVDFSPDFFEARISSEMVRAPGEGGWIFQAVARGEGRFIFTSIVSCDEPIPCPMMPARLELAIIVE